MWMKWDEMKQIAYAVLRNCNDVPFCEIRVEKTVTWSALVSQNRISKLYSTADEGINISLYSKERKTSLILPGEQAKDNAASLPHLVKKMSQSTNSAPTWIEMAETRSCHENCTEQFAPCDDLLSMAERTLQEVQLLQATSTKIDVVSNCGTVRKAYLNTVGADSEASYPFSEYDLFLRGGPLEISYSGYVNRAPHKSDDMLSAVIDYMKHICKPLSRARQVKPRRCPLVLDVVPFSVIVHEVFGHLLEYDLATKTCFSKKDLETAIVPSILTIRDIPSLKNSFHVPFDEEGTAGEEALLVEEGILKTFLADRKTAYETCQVPKGNCRAQCYTHSPMIRSRITVLEPGDHSFQELLEEAEGGLYLYGAYFVDAQPDGTFTVKVPLAYPIQKGELGDPLLRIRLSGNIFDFSKQIVALEKESQFQIGHCSKGTSGNVQQVKVGTICPRAAFRSWDVESDTG